MTSGWLFVNKTTIEMPTRFPLSPWLLLLLCFTAVFNSLAICNPLPWQERDTNNNVLVTYTRGQDWGGDIQTAGGIGGLLARTDGNGSTFYHADGSGDITALMGGNENIVARYLYNPFGKLLGQWGSLANANEMQFSSMPMRHGVSLYSFRRYEPNLQRWLNQDPIGEWGGLNLYQFAGNKSINAIDLYGLYEDLGNGMTAESFGGQPTIILNGGSVYPNYVETDLANYQATGDNRWLNDLPPDVPPASIQDVFNPDAAQNGLQGMSMLLALKGLDGENGPDAGGKPIDCPLKSTPVSRWGRPGLQPGDWVMNGPKSPLNYALSFKWQPGLDNEFAPYNSGENFDVDPSDLQWPQGWGIDGRWKGIFGQRKYVGPSKQ